MASRHRGLRSARPPNLRAAPIQVGVTKPGALLVREWNGKLQRVMVLEEGFAWNGETYGSLSQIAKAMTGTSWNGHRFFGLRTAKCKRSAAPNHGVGVLDCASPDRHSKPRRRADSLSDTRTTNEEMALVAATERCESRKASL